MKLEIIGLFARRIGSSYTIHQAAKELKKSYATVHKYINQMIDEGILLARKVGPSILCELAFQNEATIGYLTMYSIINSQKSNINKGNIDNEKIVCAIRVNKINYVYSCQETNIRAKELNLNNLRNLVKKGSRIHILKGHEYFWRMLRWV